MSPPASQRAERIAHDVRTRPMHCAAERGRGAAPASQRAERIAHDVRTRPMHCAAERGADGAARRPYQVQVFNARQFVMNSELIKRLGYSRKRLAESLNYSSSIRKEAEEGGCGVVGFCCS